MNKNHVHKSLSRQIMIAGVPLNWFVFELLGIALFIMWTKQVLIALVLFIAAHIWSWLETRKDPAWIEIYLTRIRNLKNPKRTKRYKA